MTLKDLYQRPGFLLRRTHQISAAVFENACASVGLTPAQYGVLTVLANEPGLDQTGWRARWPSTRSRSCGCARGWKSAA